MSVSKNVTVPDGNATTAVRSMTPPTHEPVRHDNRATGAPRVASGVTEQASPTATNRSDVRFPTVGDAAVGDYCRDIRMRRSGRAWWRRGRCSRTGPGCCTSSRPRRVCATGSVGCKLERHGDLGGSARDEPEELHAEGRRKAGRSTCSRPSDRGLPQGVGGRRLGPRAAGLGQPLAHADGVRRGPRVLRKPRGRRRPGRLHRRDDPGDLGRSYAAEPERPRRAACRGRNPRWADTVLFKCPDQLGVDYNARLIETVLRDLAPGLSWR